MHFYSLRTSAGLNKGNAGSLGKPYSEFHVVVLGSTNRETPEYIEGRLRKKMTLGEKEERVGKVAGEEVKGERKEKNLKK